MNVTVQVAKSHGLCSLDDVRRLRTLLALGDLKLYLVPFLQTLITLRTDGAVMNKYIRPIRASNEAVTLGIIEPFHCAFQSFHEPLFLHALARGGEGRARSQ